MSSQKVKIRLAPTSMEGNDFINNLREGLEKNGFEISDFKFWRFGDLLKNKSTTKIIYLHWPESMWRFASFPKFFIKLIQFIFSVKFGKLLGYKYVWSAHNVKPHNQVYFPKWERIARRFILKNFNLIIGHSSNCKNDLQQEYKVSIKNYTLAYHGIYDKTELNQVPERLSELDFSKKTFLIFYDKNPYKGGEKFIEYFLENQNEYKDIQLIIGKANENHIGDNITSISGHLSDEEMAYLFTKSDYLILPYKEITTSGMFFLSVTYELPVLAPSISFFESHGVNNSTVYTYDPEDYNNSIKQQIIKLPKKTLNKDFSTLKDMYNWNETNNKIFKAIESIVK